MLDHVRDAFDAADRYDAHAQIQRIAACGLADRIATLNLPPAPRILEIGCGTGFLTEALIGRLPGADWTITDFAPAMIERCADRLHRPAGIRFRTLDGEHPDPALGQFDLICSSFVFQWFADLPGALARLTAMLRPGGRIAFATMATDSLAEWRVAHRIATGQDAAMDDYPTPALLARMAPHDIDTAGITIDQQWETESFPDAHAFLTSLRAIGANRPRAPRAPLPGSALRRAMAIFEARGATVTWHIAYVVMRRREAAKAQDTA